MIDRPPRTNPLSWSESGAPIRFALIGATGFAVDAGLLTLFINYSQWTPWCARIPSFLVAVLVTWTLNRKFTFADRGLPRGFTDAFWYTLIQIGGALVNLSIFGLCLHYFEALSRMPVLPLMIGAVGGLAFNFTLSNFVLYARPRL